ncbi:unnamed protein product [Musa hybrid cultivar]
MGTDPIEDFWIDGGDSDGELQYALGSFRDMVPTAGMGNEETHRDFRSLEQNSSGKRARNEPHTSKSKACREKVRRDRLNERFHELSSVLDPNRPPRADKASILGDATRVLMQLRAEAQELKESNEKLHEAIKDLKVEKNELREEKMRLKADKDKLEQQIKWRTMFVVEPTSLLINLNSIIRRSEVKFKIMEGARIPLKGWQQAAVALGSALGALMDPRRADLIAALGETTGKPAFQRVLERMRNSSEGREVLLERPRVISAEVSHAWDLPESTFGSAYARFMGTRNFSPDDRPPVRFMDTDELAYVATRAREVHDFWHVLFGLPTNLIGESALKVIEFQQMFLPMCALSVVGGSARFSEKQRALFFQHYFPWALRAGMASTDLMCVYYEKHFHEDLEDVRKKWGIIPCPDPKGKS